MSANVGVLAHYQDSTVKPSSHLPKDVAKMLVSRMAAERISHKVIRMFAPGRFNAVTKAFARRHENMSAEELRAISLPHPFGGEIGGIKVRLDRKFPPNETISSVRRTRAIDTDWRFEGEIRRDLANDVPCVQSDVVGGRGESPELEGAAC